MTASIKVTVAIQQLQREIDATVRYATNIGLTRQVEEHFEPSSEKPLFPLVHSQSHFWKTIRKLGFFR